MKFLSTVLLAATSAHAYYSEGWQPGQPATRYMTSTTTAPNSIPTDSPANIAGAANAPWSLKDFKFPSLEDILTKGPVANLLGRAGVNVTERLVLAREGIPSRFAEEIQLIHDHDYEDIILNEQFASEEDARERVWALIVTVGPQDPVSDYYDKVFNAAHNVTLKEGDLKNVRWGRIDYMEVTEITTRWVIWKAPMLVIAQDNGKTLRFYRGKALTEVNNPSKFRQFLLDEAYEASPPWSGPWAPTGSRAAFLHTIARYAAYIYSWLVIMPRWLLLLVTGTFASTVIGYMHAGEGQIVPGSGAKKN